MCIHIIPQLQYFYFLGFYFLQVDGLQVASANVGGSVEHSNALKQAYKIKVK